MNHFSRLVLSAPVAMATVYNSKFAISFEKSFAKQTQSIVFVINTC